MIGKKIFQLLDINIESGQQYIKYKYMEISLQTCSFGSSIILVGQMKLHQGTTPCVKWGCCQSILRHDH